MEKTDQEMIKHLDEKFDKTSIKFLNDCVDYLKENKLCPSILGLDDFYKFECKHGDYIVDCDYCREKSVENLKNKNK